MIATNSENRHTAVSALKTVFEMFESLYEIPDVFLFSSIKSELLSIKVLEELQEQTAEMIIEEYSEKDVETAPTAATTSIPLKEKIQNYDYTSNTITINHVKLKKSF